MRRVIHLPLVLFLGSNVAAQNNSIRGGRKRDSKNEAHQEKEEQKDDRSLYGLEYGIEGFQALFASHEQLPQGHIDTFREVEGTTTEGQQVFFQPIPQPLEDQGEEPQTRIYGGENSPEMRSFVMHLKYTSDGNYLSGGCAGTLISPCHILTAAHCSANERAGLPDAVYVNAYAPFAGNSGKDFHFSKLSEIHVHPDFNDDVNANDVAVLTMETCADISKYPVMELADSNFMASLSAGTSVVASGFGKMSNGNAYSSILQKVDVQYWDQDKCKNENYPSRILPDMICAGDSNGGKDACQGDSGGPLWMEVNGVPTQLGIVSWGLGCGVADQPGVYSSVAYHMEFIQEKVCDHAGVDKSTLKMCQGATPAIQGTQNTCERACSSNADCTCSNYFCHRRDNVCTRAGNGRSSIFGNFGRRRNWD